APSILCPPRVCRQSGPLYRWFKTNSPLFTFRACAQIDHFAAPPLTPTAPYRLVARKPRRRHGQLEPEPAVGGIASCRDRTAADLGHTAAAIAASICSPFAVPVSCALMSATS